jgi:membrane-associated phospholipid phosphatase
VKLDADFVAHGLASGLNPLLTAALLLVPSARVREGSRRTQAYCQEFVRTAMGVAGAVTLAEWGKRQTAWPGHYGFPSGHETFAVAAATCLVLRDRRWVPLAVPVAGIMGWALVRAGYHDWPDVLGGAALGAAIPLMVSAASAAAATQAKEKC